jgi:hypothetical protein
VPSTRICCVIHPHTVIRDGTRWKQRDYLKVDDSNVSFVCMWLIVSLGSIVYMRVKQSPLFCCYLCRTCRIRYDAWRGGASDNSLVIEAASAAKGERRERKKEDPRVPLAVPAQSVASHSSAPGVLFPVSVSAPSLNVSASVSAAPSTPIFLNPSLAGTSSLSSSSSSPSSSSSSPSSSSSSPSSSLSPSSSSSSPASSSSHASSSSTSTAHSAPGHHSQHCCGSAHERVSDHVRGKGTSNIFIQVFR